MMDNTNRFNQEKTPKNLLVHSVSLVYLLAEIFNNKESNWKFVYMFINLFKWPYIGPALKPLMPIQLEKQTSLLYQIR